MNNAHLRMGSLRFTKVLRDTTIDITLGMDRMIAEHDADNRRAKCHLLSVVGNDQEMRHRLAVMDVEAILQGMAQARQRAELLARTAR